MQLLWSAPMTVLYTGTERALLWWEFSIDAPPGPQLSLRGELVVGAMPSFLAFSRHGPLAVALSEEDDRLCSMRVEEDGALVELSNQPCPGGPAYVSLSASEKWALAASYKSGQLHVFPVDEAGRLGPCCGSVDSGRFSHCAYVDPGSDWIYVPSKGTDSVYLTRLDDRSGALCDARRLETEAGSGPRHLVVSPDGTRAYLANENDCTLTIYRRRLQQDAPRLELLDRVSALLRPAEGTDSGADVHVSPDGNFIYMSVRGRDVVTVFRRTESGVEPVSEVSTAGRVPRNFCLLGDQALVVANQESASLTVFRRDTKSGGLVELGTCEVGERVFWVGNSSTF